MGRTVELRTEIPGPNSRAIVARKERVVAAAKTLVAPVVIDRGAGCTVTDVDGNTFLDWSGGIGCLNVGHTNPRVTAALHAQIDRFLHTDFTILPYESYVELAERLVERTPISGPKKAAFFNSGAEAVENAVKIARHATGRQAVIAFEGAFHGRTLMAMSLTSKQHPYKAGMGPFAPEVYRAPFPNPYRWPGSDPAGEALDALRRMLTTHVAAENVAAIVFEPVQGEGGFIVPPVEWVQGLRELASKHGIVLVADEVQSGFGRTGKLFAIEHFGIEPDLIVVAKSIAAGVPLSGVVGRAEIVDAAPDSSIGGTFVGSPLGCVAGLAVIEELEGGLLDRGVAIGERIRGSVRGAERAVRPDRRRARAGADARHGVRREPGVEGAGSGDRGSGARGGAPIGADPAPGGRLLQLHPRPRLARCHRRAGRRGPRHPLSGRSGNVCLGAARRNARNLVLYKQRGE